MVPPLTPHELELVNVVRERINNARPIPADMTVTREELAACERAVRIHLEEHNQPPFPHSRTGRGFLFKNVELTSE